MAKKPGQNTLTGIHHIMSVNQVSSTPASASLLSTKAKLKQFRTNESPIPNQVIQHHQQRLADCTGSSTIGLFCWGECKICLAQRVQRSWTTGELVMELEHTFHWLYSTYNPILFSQTTKYKQLSQLCIRREFPPATKNLFFC